VLRLPRPNANAARNVAIAAARGDVLLSIDDDVLFGPDYASRHAARYAKPQTGFVMALTLDRVDQPQREALAAHAALLALPQIPGADTLVPIKWAPTCSTSYRKAAILKAGGFDPYFTGGVADDTDIAVRILATGFSGFLDTGIALTHLAATSGGYASRDPQRTFERRLNDQRMRLYFASKNRLLIGTRDAARLFVSSLRVVLRACRDRYGLAGWLRAPFAFARLAWHAARDARTNAAHR
jgi:glycosyltransferase involved in cell wall biosynthesis